MKKTVCGSAAPLLDNIETSCKEQSVPKLNNINAFPASDDKKLSTALESAAYYKKLSAVVSDCLAACAPEYKDTSEYLAGIVPLRDAAYKINACGTRIGFSDSGEILTANFCRLRVCPMCQRRRSLRVAADFHKIIDSLDCSWLHLVLTVPNCSADELSNLLDTMQVCSSRLFRMDIIKKAFKGVARCTEISYNFSRGDYHPHFHCLVAVNKSYFKSRYYINILLLRKLWTVICNSAFSGVNVRSKNDLYFCEMVDNFDEDCEVLYQCHIGKADDNAIAEIAKYAVKPLDLGLSGSALYKPLCVIYFALHGRRLIQTYGEVKRAASALRVGFDTLPENDDGKLDRTNVRLYNWDSSVGSYISDSLFSSATPFTQF